MPTSPTSTSTTSTNQTPPCHSACTESARSASPVPPQPWPTPYDTPPANAYATSRSPSTNCCDDADGNLSSTALPRRGQVEGRVVPRWTRDISPGRHLTE